MKLPINALLYLVSAAALGGIVHSVYQYSDKSLDYDKAALKKIQAENELAKKAGALKDVREGWTYDTKPFWTQLRDANFTGKVEKVATKIEESKPVEEEKKQELIDLSEVIEVICITRAGNETGVVVKYLTNVEVPPDQVVTPSTPSIANTVPRGRRGRVNIPQPATPAASSGAAPPQHVKIGEKLWPGFEYVALKAVSDDASHAIFELQIEDKKDEKTGFPVQKVYKGHLDLPAEVLEKMRAGEITSETGRPQPKDDVARDTPASAWIDTPDTTVSRDGRVNISRKDQTFLESNGQDVFTDDVHMKDYSGGSGKHRIRGVQIRRLSTRVRQYGVQEGDVLISINGKSVSGMANAKKVGRRLYNQGVRSFRAEILRQGRIITRTYHFKDKK